MKTAIDKTQDQQRVAGPRVQQEPGTGGTATIADNRPSTLYQRKLRTAMNNSPRVTQLREKQTMMNNSPHVQSHATLRATMNDHAAGKALPVQRKAPKGSSRFQQIATAMGNKHGVDTSGLVATHNSSFPAKLNAEATIQGNSIHFAPGMDTHYNIRHEVAHAIDNTLNGTPKGDRVVNGQMVDTTREKSADRMAKASSGVFQRESLPVQRKLRETMHNSSRVQEDVALQASMNANTTSNALPVQRVRTREFHEDQATLMPLFRYKDNTEKTYYNCDSNGKVELADNKNPKISTMGNHTYDVIKSIPNPPGLPPGNYVLFSYLTIQDGGGTLNNYGLVAENKITFLAEYKDIAEIAADVHNPKQGKILPENEADPQVSHSDVHQTAINDCYLHSALISVVKSNPQDIIDLFDPKPDESRVTVAFPEVYNYDDRDFTQGYDDKRDTVIMSRSLFLKADGSPLYGGRKSGYLWPAFVQKAWAVLKKSYANITMGSTMKIARKITGRKDPDRLLSADRVIPTTDSQKISTNRAWEIYDNINAALKANKAVNLGTKYWEKEKEKKKSKLSYLHSYAIVGMKKHLINPSRTYFMPNATLTLRDPMEKEGNTFKISFKEIMDPKKVDHISYV